MGSSKCCHDLNKEGNTLTIVKRRIMSYPPQTDCICSVCQKAIKFKKGEDDGKYIRIRETKKSV